MPGGAGSGLTSQYCSRQCRADGQVRVRGRWLRLLLLLALCWAALRLTFFRQKLFLQWQPL